MGTKILYLDDDGDICFAVAVYAGLYESNRYGRGVRIDTMDDDTLFIANKEYPEDIVRQLYTNDKVDLTLYGNVTDISD